MTTYQKPDGSVVIEASAEEAQMLDSAINAYGRKVDRAKWGRLLEGLRYRQVLMAPPDPNDITRHKKT